MTRPPTDEDEDQPRPSRTLGIDTFLTLPIVKAVGFSIALVGVGWGANVYMGRLTAGVERVSEEVGRLRADIDRRLSDRWTRNDQRFWAYDLQNANTGRITVPLVPAAPSGSAP